MLHSPTSFPFLFGLLFSSPLLSRFHTLPLLSPALPSYLPPLAGFLVSLGSSFSNGCTSGHALCGLSRFSVRSIIATCIFMLVSSLVSTLLNLSSVLPNPSVYHSPASLPALLLLAALHPLPLVALHKRFPGLRSALDAVLELVWGFCFGAGLLVTGMASPGKVVAFLDVRGQHWDPSLLFVFVGALPIAIAGFTPLMAGTPPMLRAASQLPTTKHVDARLVLGSALFGAGWGAAGMCPGPVVVNLGAGAGVQTVVAGFVMGSLCAKFVKNKMF